MMIRRNKKSAVLNAEENSASEEVVIKNVKKPKKTTKAKAEK